ncbi:hypothetical protein HDV57DRAFT_44041 [Trichoderma longibrachiatum]
MFLDKRRHRGVGRGFVFFLALLKPHTLFFFLLPDNLTSVARLTALEPLSTNSAWGQALLIVHTDQHLISLSHLPLCKNTGGRHFDVSGWQRIIAASCRHCPSCLSQSLLWTTVCPDTACYLAPSISLTGTSLSLSLFSLSILLSLCHSLQSSDRNSGCCLMQALSRLRSLFDPAEESKKHEVNNNNTTAVAGLGCMRVPHHPQTPAQSCSFDRPASCTSWTARAATANCICSADNSRSLLTYLPPHRASELTRPGQARMPGCQDAKMLVRSSGAAVCRSASFPCPLRQLSSFAHVLLLLACLLAYLCLF